jgi:glycosyltransferase involved in cell wall biosynthesis
VQWSDDVVVFDSYSCDQTTQIATRSGARVRQRAFDNYAAQRNAALHDPAFKNPWVLMLDADERVPAELAAEMQAMTTRPNSEFTLYRMRRKDMFLGRWLRRSSGYPTWFGRLIRLGYVRVEREINEEYHTNGKVGLLQEHLIHYPFNRGVSYWFERHNRYSSMEAEVLFSEPHTTQSFKGLFSTDPALRRKILKQIAYRLPGRPLLVFGYLYLVRLGILDGRPGLIYCILRCIYEHMIDIKVKELQQRAKGQAL